MFLNLVPGHMITVYESMRLWKGKAMPGWMFVHRKPTPIGRESHTTADYDTGNVIRGALLGEDKNQDCRLCGRGRLKSCQGATLC